MLSNLKIDRHSRILRMYILSPFVFVLLDSEDTIEIKFRVVVLWGVDIWLYLLLAVVNPECTRVTTDCLCGIALALGCILNNICIL